MRPAVLTLTLPISAEYISAALEALTGINAVMIAERGLPDVYDAKVTYRRERPGRERWQNAAETLALGYGDCEDLACWRAAWLRVNEAEPARAVAIPGGPHTIHIVVVRGDGSIEDPSADLGMLDQ